MAENKYTEIPEVETDRMSAEADDYAQAIMATLSGLKPEDKVKQFEKALHTLFMVKEKRIYVLNKERNEWKNRAIKAQTPSE